MFYTSKPPQSLIEKAKSLPHGRLLDIVKGADWHKELARQATWMELQKELLGRYVNHDNGEFLEAFLLNEEEDVNDEYWAFYCLP